MANGCYVNQEEDSHGHSVAGKKYVIYTVITGDFDAIKQPLVIDKRFDYILFSDAIIENSGVWQVRVIPFDDADKRLCSRFPKLRPDICLEEYDASLYIDGTIQITSQYVYDRFIELANDGIEWAGMKHQARESLMDEINAILGLAWVHDYEVLDWYKFLVNEKFPDNIGLYENNIIFRSHTVNTQKVNDIWWWSFVTYRYRRDQFSLMYAIWKVSTLKRTLFLPAGETAWHNNGHFLYTKHNPHERGLKRSKWETARNRCARVCFNPRNDEYGTFTRMYDRIIPFRYPHVAMHIWTLYAILRYGYKVIYEMITIRIKHPH